MAQTNAHGVNTPWCPEQVSVHVDWRVNEIGWWLFVGNGSCIRR
jgi:hypothetical protein